MAKKGNTVLKSAKKLLAVPPLQNAKFDMHGILSSFAKKNGLVIRHNLCTRISETGFVHPCGCPSD